MTNLTEKNTKMCFKDTKKGKKPKIKSVRCTNCSNSLNDNSLAAKSFFWKKCLRSYYQEARAASILTGAAASFNVLEVTIEWLNSCFFKRGRGNKRCFSQWVRTKFEQGNEFPTVLNSEQILWPSPYVGLSNPKDSFKKNSLYISAQIGRQDTKLYYVHLCRIKEIAPHVAADTYWACWQAGRLAIRFSFQSSLSKSHSAISSWSLLTE